ncbi:25112_t:CDS:2 [Cetraspora pellucida]|uniref:25112_t:CDS:1 n=1 Tax=Cetraspora pellucida TaxID=1433469 RepID=A0A9N8W6T9_9GLOM|nr:25112_t:CDS:2 [Cetraspora pellucida]
MWHLAHHALPLGYWLIHETTYKFLKYTAEPISSTIDNILQATNISSAYKGKQPSEFT